MQTLHILTKTAMDNEGLGKGSRARIPPHELVVAGMRSQNTVMGHLAKNMIQLGNVNYPPILNFMTNDLDKCVEM